MFPRVWRLLSLSVLVAFAASPGLAADRIKIHKLDLVLRQAVTQAPEPQRVIIRTEPGRQAALRAALTAHGDVVEAEHPSVGAMTAYVHGEDLAALANDPSVRSVSCDCEVTPSGGAKAEGKGAGQKRPRGETSSALREALGLTREMTGAGIGVAIVDSGVDPNSDFAGRIVKFWDYTRGGGEATPYDDYGHGTHVAGLIGGSGVLSNGAYQGVAPSVRLFGFKVLDKSGRGRTSAVIRALEYIAANHEYYGIHVINLSIGHPILESATTDPLVQAVEAAVRHGLVVVVSAGNNGANARTGVVGYGGINSPGNAPSAITAGASDTVHTVIRSDDRVADFSSRGPTWYDGYAKPDVVAPGVALISDAPRRATLYQQYPTLRVDSNYAQLSGTSMASAVTTGLAALVLEANRTFAGDVTLTPNAVKAIVEYTATPIRDGTGAAYNLLTQGIGEVNGEGAFRLASSVDPTVPAGQPWTAGIAAFTWFGSERTLWSENIVWGNYVVGGGVALYSSIAWDENIVWGNAVTWDGENIVWGNVDFGNRADNIVWGNVADWADNIVWGNGYLGFVTGENIVWGNSRGGDNVVWGNLTEDNIVWGNLVNASADNIIWGNGGFSDGDNIVWGNGRAGADNIVWGNGRTGGDNIVWGNGRTSGDNIVWGNGQSSDGDNIVWGNSVTNTVSTVKR